MLSLLSVESATRDTQVDVNGPGPAEAALRRRSIAVTSGKGGVGKTATAVNLALYFAGEGYRTGLLDLDPLADVAAYLDISMAEAALEAEDIDESRPLSDYTERPFDRLDILFPEVKLSAGQSQIVRRLVAEKYRDELCETYDVLLFDLPAGTEEDTNLAFADLADTIVLVTNPEPTAHMSAGGWCRAFFETRAKRPIYLWHNRYSRGGPDGFNPKAVLRNYNRNSPEEQKIDGELHSLVSDLAFVPEDPALNMLRSGAPDPLAIALRTMLQLCRQIASDRARTLLTERGVKPALRGFTVDVLDRAHAPDEAVDELVSEVELLAVDTLGAEVGARVSSLASIMRRDRSLSLLGDERRGVLAEAIDAVRGDALWQDAVRARRRCEDAAARAGERARMFAGQPHGAVDHAARLADDAVRSLLVTLSEEPDTEIRRNAKILLFYLAYFKLIRNDSVLGRVRSVIPKRKNGNRTERDRRTQIRYLVDGNETYRKAYVELIRTLFPLVTRQISALARAVGAGELLIRRNGGVERRAYLTLLSNAVHDCLFSGLGVITGFRYREASRAFAEAAASLKDQLLPERAAERGRPEE